MRRFDAETVRLSRQLDALLKCATCGLSTLVLSKNALGRRRAIQIAPVTPETHCACPGGPAHVAKGPTDADWMKAVTNG